MCILFIFHLINIISFIYFGNKICPSAVRFTQQHLSAPKTQQIQYDDNNYQKLQNGYK